MTDQRDHKSFYIDGSWVEATGSGRIDVINASTEEVMGSVPQAEAADVDAAVKAAESAFAGWASRSPSERAELLSGLGDALEERCEELAILEAREVGTPIVEGREAQVLQAVEFLKLMPSSVEAVTWEEQVGQSVVRKLPVGVVGGITAWNFPLQILAAKTSAALAAGCTIVLKGSELAPLSSFAFAEAAHQAGIPAGVVNVISGDGPGAGSALVGHPGLAKITFTGSGPTARSIAAAAAPNLTALSFELGGKSASVVLEDADLESAVVGTLANAFQGNGQVCCATTRMIVPRSMLKQAEEIAAETVRNLWPVGDPLDEATRIGPLVSERQRDRVRGYIDLGVRDGASVVTGGSGSPKGASRGYFVQPTVFSSLTNAAAVAREEIFGPVLVMIASDGDDDAIRIANDSPYGLGGAVWAGDLGRAQSAARQIRTGQVEINGAPWNPVAPFGGFNQSGFGRENGRFGIEEFLTYQTITS